MAQRIAVMGFHRPTQQGFRSSEWDEVYCLAHDPLVHRATRVMEAHSEQIVRAHGPRHIEVLKSLHAPLTTAWQWTVDLGEDHQVRPYTSLQYGPAIESSVAFSMALAMEEQPDEIGLFGIDLTSSEEYVYQRANMAYLIGRAEGAGIKVWIHPDSGLLKSQWTGGCYGHPDNVDDMRYRLVA